MQSLGLWDNFGQRKTDFVQKVLGLAYIGTPRWPVQYCNVLPIQIFLHHVCSVWSSSTSNQHAVVAIVLTHIWEQVILENIQIHATWEVLIQNSEVAFSLVVDSSPHMDRTISVSDVTLEFVIPKVIISGTTHIDTSICFLEYRSTLVTEHRMTPL
mgnify:CR=1 FL=1